MTPQKLYKIQCEIPENVVVEKHPTTLVFSGPLGSSALHLEKIDAEGTCAFSFCPTQARLTVITSSKASCGLLKKLIANKIQGVTRGFLVYLKILGIGYRAYLEKNTLIFKVGYSHDILYTIPSSIKLFLVDPTLLCIFGIEKNQVTEIASKLRKLRAPSVYKGKGIRFQKEKIHLKTGKRK